MSWVQNYPNPAGAGMHRRAFVRYRRPAPEPRRRGDAPPFANCWKIVGNRTPQARGCTAWLDIAAQVRIPNPAGAGMHRLDARSVNWSSAEPRRRGDAPLEVSSNKAANGPNPAGAGMHRFQTVPSLQSETEPRRRGDAPDAALARPKIQVRTPQARGCTAQAFSPHEPARPNPAGAGMHRPGTRPGTRARTEPRRRGDAPPIV